MPPLIRIANPPPCFKVRFKGRVPYYGKPKNITLRNKDCRGVHPCPTCNTPEQQFDVQLTDVEPTIQNFTSGLIVELYNSLK